MTCEDLIILFLIAGRAKVTKAVIRDMMRPTIYGNIFSVDHLLIENELLLKYKSA